MTQRMNQPAQIIFWPIGGVSVRDKDGETIDNLQGKGWMQLYFEYLESLGFDPTTIQFQALINGAWTNVNPIRHDNGWSMSFSKAEL